MNEIIAVGPIIISNSKLLVVHDGKDPFFKIPGGKLKPGEDLESCLHRELFEETSYKCKILKQLSTQILNKKPGTNEEGNIKLYHFKSKLLNKLENYDPFYNNYHFVNWLSILDIKNNKYLVSPNIKFLIEKGEI